MDDETWIAAGQPYGDGSTSGNEQVRAEQNNSQGAGGGTLGEAKAHPSREIYSVLPIGDKDYGVMDTAEASNHGLCHWSADKGLMTIDLGVDEVLCSDPRTPTPDSCALAIQNSPRTVTIPYGPFTDEEDNAIERFPHEEDTSDDEVHNPTVVGSQWNVGHKGGDYRYNAQNIIDIMFHPSINSAAAIQMLHNRNSIRDRIRIKWIPRSAVESIDHIQMEFFLDFSSIIGRPGEAISKLGCPLSESIPMPFSNWCDKGSILGLN
ncbi:hypothetical protein E4U48_005988 [Claviceps purpurea]|nr:hypothetical protein E4U48_005988 [Claviceps purpurea]